MRLREEAKCGRDPTCADETLALLLEKGQGASRILEVGAGYGLTSVALALGTGAEVYAVEKDAGRAREARGLIAKFGANVRLLEGDAAVILPTLKGPFDLIFLDGPKAQYKNYLPELRRLLKTGGYLFSDDVFLFGRRGERAPQKRHMLALHIREYLGLLEDGFETEYYEYGEGLAVSKKL